MAKKTTPAPPPPEAPKLAIALPPLVEPERQLDIDVASDSVDDVRVFMTAPKKVVNAPDISRLPDALGPDGRPLFRVGDRIVLERHASIFADKPYLDTRTWYVNDVDLETGQVKLFDEGLMQHGTANWKIGPLNGCVFKLAMGAKVSTKRKRGRPRKNPIEAVVTTTVTRPGEKKKRGRPKGSKNRPKEVVAAERVAKAAAKRAKKAKHK